MERAVILDELNTSLALLQRELATDKNGTAVHTCSLTTTSTPVVDWLKEQDVELSLGTFHQTPTLLLVCTTELVFVSQLKARQHCESEFSQLAFM